MKTVIKKVVKDALKRYLPIIINALCAFICITAGGCTLAAKYLDISFTTTFNEKGE